MLGGNRDAENLDPQDPDGSDEYEADSVADTAAGALSPGTTATGAPTGRD